MFECFLFFQPCCRHPGIKRYQLIINQLPFVFEVIICLHGHQKLHFFVRVKIRYTAWCFLRYILNFTR